MVSITTPPPSHTHPLPDLCRATQQQLAEEKAQREGAETAAQQAQRERDEAINALESKVGARLTGANPAELLWHEGRGECSG